MTDVSRSAGGQFKRYKDATKTTLKACRIQAPLLEEMAQDRSAWRSAVTAGLQTFEEDRNKWLETRREKRHQRTTTTDDALVCPECGRTFVAAIRLRSHLRAHRRRRQAGRGRTVIFDPEGLPQASKQRYTKVNSSFFLYKFSQCSQHDLFTHL